jgi:hypothetical protein
LQALPSSIEILASRSGLAGRNVPRSSVWTDASSACEVTVVIRAGSTRCFPRLWTPPETDANFATLAVDQVGALAQHRDRRTDFPESCLQGRTRQLAAALLGHSIRDDYDFARHIDDVHINPVKHRLVTRVRAWPYSSFHRIVEFGIYPEDRPATSQMTVWILASRPGATR